jgi:single-strand DNA-binding protein
MVVNPELRLVGEKPYCHFRIAVNRGKEKVDFFNVVAWNKTAEFATEYFQKGERLIIHGTIRNADYIDKDDKKQYSVEILADRLEFVETMKSKKTASSSEMFPKHEKNSTSEFPSSEAGTAQPLLITPDDLPS